MLKLRFWFWLTVLFTLVVLFAGSVWGALPWEPEFSWTFPTEYESGAPLDVSQITETRIYCDGATTPTFTIVAPTNQIVSPFKFFDAGSHTCYATVVDVEGAESAPSNSVPFDVPADKAVPPALNVN